MTYFGWQDDVTGHAKYDSSRDGSRRATGERVISFRTPFKLIAAGISTIPVVVAGCAVQAVPSGPAGAACVGQFARRTGSRCSAPTSSDSATPVPKRTPVQAFADRVEKVGGTRFAPTYAGTDVTADGVVQIFVSNARDPRLKAAIADLNTHDFPVHYLSIAGAQLVLDHNVAAPGDSIPYKVINHSQAAIDPDLALVEKHTTHGWTIVRPKRLVAYAGVGVIVPPRQVSRTPMSAWVPGDTKPGGTYRVALSIFADRSGPNVYPPRGLHEFHIYSALTVTKRY